MRKKDVTVLLMSLVSISLLAGCSKGQTEPSRPPSFSVPQYQWDAISGRTLTVWGEKTNLNRIYVQDMFRRYEELTKNKLEVRELTKQEMDTLVPEVFQNPNMEAPDILISSGGTNLINLDPNKNFFDFSNADWVDNLVDTAVNQTVYEGKIVGLPFGEASVSGTLYHKKIFEKYNIPVPTNQKEFLDTCEALLKNGITPLYLPYAEISMLLYQFPMDSIFQDEEVLSALNSKELTYSQIPQMRTILEWYKTMADKGYFGEGYTGNDWNGMNDAMLSGQYGMMICWDTWLYTDYQGAPGDFGLMPAFMGVPEEGTFEGANLMLFLANKNSRNLDASLNFIKFIADPYNYNVVLSSFYTAPVFTKQVGSLSTPQYVESERQIEKLYHDSIAWQRIVGFSQIDAVYIQNYMQGTCTIEEALQSMDEARLGRADKLLK